MKLENNIRKIIREELVKITNEDSSSSGGDLALLKIETRHQKYKKLKLGESIIVYRGVHESGVNFYTGKTPLPFKYYALTKEKAEYYGIVSEYLFKGKVFFGNLFDRFGVNANIEKTEIIEELISEGYQAALIKGNELVVFDKNTIKQLDKI